LQFLSSLLYKKNDNHFVNIINRFVTQLNSDLTAVKGDLTFAGKTIHRILYCAGSDNNGTYPWINITVPNLGSYKLSTYPGMIVQITGLTDNSIFVTGSTRASDTQLTVMLSKATTNSFVLSIICLVASAQ